MQRLRFSIVQLFPCCARDRWSFGRRGIMLLLLFCTFTSAGEFEVTDLFGRTKQASISAIDAKGVHLQVGDKAGVHQLSDLRSIRRIAAAPVKVDQTNVELLLIGGGRLFADRVTMDEESCVLRGCSFSSEPLSIPLDFVRALVFAPQLVTPEMRKELVEPREEDRFLVKIEETVETLDGLVEGLSDSELTFSWNDGVRKLGTKDVIAIGIADAGAEVKGNARVRLLDSQAVKGEIAELNEGHLAIRLFGMATHSVPWAKVAAIEIDSDRLHYLSDLEPDVSTHKPIVTIKRTWRRDRNVNGEQLQLGESVYSKGIGVASWSLLKFSLAEDYSTFCATLGIDSSTEGRGDCVFVVRGDGKELLREPMKGTDAARAVRVELGNTRELELIVLPGNDLDLSDHANWCDACVLK